MKLAYALLVTQNTNGAVLKVWSPDFDRDFYHDSDQHMLNIGKIAERITQHINFLNKEDLKFDYPQGIKHYKNLLKLEKDQYWTKAYVETDIKVRKFEKTLPKVGILLFLLTALGSSLLTGLSLAVTPLGAGTTILSVVGIVISISAYMLVYLFSNTVNDYVKTGRYLDNINLSQSPKNENTEIQVYPQLNPSTTNSTTKILVTLGLGAIVIGDALSTGIKIYQEMVKLGEAGNKEGTISIPQSAINTAATIFGITTVLSMLAFDTSFARIAYKSILNKLNKCSKDPENLSLDEETPILVESIIEIVDLDDESKKTFPTL